MGEELYFVSKTYGFQVMAFTLMPNHFHLLARMPSGELEKPMRHFMRMVTTRVNEKSHRVHQLWSARYYRSLVAHPSYFLNAYKYIYRNPVQANLVERVEKWPFQTLSGLLGLQHLFIPVASDDTLFPDVESTLKWLNTPVSNEHWQVIKEGLARTEFKLIIRDVRRRRIPDTEFRI